MLKRWKMTLETVEKYSKFDIFVEFGTDPIDKTDK